jgi:hypothetical protein
MMAPPLTRTLTRSVRDLHRRAVFHHAMKRFVADPEKTASQPELLGQLVYGWGNTGWSGEPEYLQACIRHALECRAPILECGSGLTTLLVGHLAQRNGTSLWSLEHMPHWGERVQHALARFAITSVRLCTAPIRSYGEFDWYDPPLRAMPEQFALVICDGPPSATRGGRYGLGAIMGPRLRDGCTILLDDAGRSDERHIAARWASEFDMLCELRGVAKPYFVLTRVAGQRAPARAQNCQ